MANCYICGRSDQEVTLENCVDGVSVEGFGTLLFEDDFLCVDAENCISHFEHDDSAWWEW